MALLKFALREKNTICNILLLPVVKVNKGPGFGNTAIAGSEKSPLLLSRHHRSTGEEGIQPTELPSKEGEATWRAYHTIKTWKRMTSIWKALFKEKISQLK